MSLPNELEALKVATTCVGLIPALDLRIMCIQNTKKLEMVEVSEAYAKDIMTRKDLNVIKPARPIPFLENGYLPSFREWS